MPRRLLLLGLLTLVRCGPPRLDIVAPPGSLLAFASVDRSGQLGRVGLLHSPAERSAELEASGTKLFGWIIAPSDLIDEQGAPLDPASREALVLRSTSEAATGSGSCGRCLAPAARAPQVLMSGDSCSIPSFVEGQAWAVSGTSFVDSTRADGPALEEVRRRLRLERPGACGCERPAPVELGRLRFEAVLPTSAPHYFGAVAAVGTSTMVALSKDLIRVFDLRDGQAHDYRWNEAEGVVPVAAVADGDTIWVSSLDRGLRRPAPIRIDRLRLSSRGIERTDLGHVSDEVGRIAALRNLAMGPTTPVRRVFAYGDDGSPGKRASIAHCDEGSAACVRERIGCVDVFSGADEVNALSWEASYGAVALSSHHLLVQPELDAVWSCSKLNVIDNAQAMARGPEAFVVCGRADNYFVIMAAPTNGGIPSAPELMTTFTSTTPDRRCRGVWSTPEGFDVLMAGPPEGQLIRLDRRGHIRSLTPTRQALGARVNAAWVLPGGRLAARDQTNSLLVGPMGGPLNRIYGEAQDNDVGSYRVAEIAQGEAWLIGSSPLRIARVQSSTVIVYPAEDGGATLTAWSARSAIIDHSAARQPTFSMNIENAQHGRRVVRVELRAGRAVLLEDFVPSELRPIGIVELTPGRFAVARSTGIELWPGMAPDNALELDFDDPRTPTVDVAPPKLFSNLWMSGGRGAAWFVTDVLLGRIAGRRFERYDLGLADGQEPRGVDSACPDEALVGMSGGRAEAMNYLRLSGATADPTELVPGRIPLAGDELVINGDAIGAIPDGAGAAVVTDEGYVLRFGDERTPDRFVLGAPLDSVMAREGMVIAVGGGGRIFVGR